uniref:proline dehydrogenase n=1 Tax=Eiseniibacteriota bacterium TaxID=2212470 RepID=A0A832MJ24_UNCEI
MMRSLLLAMSRSRWLRERAMRSRWARRAVSRFMPGEDLEDMIGAARALAPDGIRAVFTRLGENVTDAAEADAVAAHYAAAIARAAEAGVDAEPSVKPTQLGLDLGVAGCLARMRAVAGHAHAAGRFLWIDMEHSPTVEPTLEITQRLRAEFPGVGVCVQAYLRRTPADVAALAAAGAGVRLVKGAYSEPASLAWTRRADIDRAYLETADTMLAASRAGRVRAVFGTHDLALVDAIRARAAAAGMPAGAVEVHMLYGIQREAQARLVAGGVTLRVLVAYGSHWFPWYMRRLAERPANVGFALRRLFG